MWCLNWVVFPTGAAVVILLQIVPARTYKGTNKNPLTGPLSLVWHTKTSGLCYLSIIAWSWSWSWRGGTKTGRGWFLGIITCMVLFRERSTSPAHAGGLYNRSTGRQGVPINQMIQSQTSSPSLCLLVFVLILAATDTLPCVKPHPS